MLSRIVSPIVGLVMILQSHVAVYDEKPGIGNEIILHGHKGAIEAVEISPKGKFASSIDTRGNDILLWAIPGGKMTKTLEGPKKKRFGAFAFSPDEKEITASFDDSLFQWRLDQPENRVEIKLQGKDEMIKAVAYSPDGTMIAAAGVGGKL